MVGPRHRRVYGSHGAVHTVAHESAQRGHRELRIVEGVGGKPSRDITTTLPRGGWAWTAAAAIRSSEQRIFIMTVSYKHGSSRGGAPRDAWGDVAAGRKTLNVALLEKLRASVISVAAANYRVPNCLWLYSSSVRSKRAAILTQNLFRCGPSSDSETSKDATLNAG